MPTGMERNPGAVQVEAVCSGVPGAPCACLCMRRAHVCTHTPIRADALAEPAACPHLSRGAASASPASDLGATGWGLPGPPNSPLLTASALPRQQQEVSGHQLRPLWLKLRGCCASHPPDQMLWASQPAPAHPQRAFWGHLGGPGLGVAREDTLLLASIPRAGAAPAPPAAGQGIAQGPRGQVGGCRGVW